MAELLTVEAALAAVLARVTTLPAEQAGLHEATGRFLSKDARAAVDLPPFPSSAMDGFALRSADTPGSLPIAYEVAAGRAVQVELPAGSAAAIATGGAVPTGADSVVPVELVSTAAGRVDVPAVAHGANVRLRGGDVRLGDTVVGRGSRLGAAQIGALAAAGVAEIVCSTRPRVTVLATGSELRAPGEPLEHGQIYESNRALLRAVLEEAGAVVEELPVVPDDEDLHRAALEDGLAADVLVTSGGVSVGPHDLVRRVEGGLGVDEVFWGVAVKPGKPLAFGVRGATLVFGLPGNPVSALVSAVLFVAPAVRALQGARDPGPVYEAATAATALSRNEHRDEFLRARRHRGPEGTLVEPVTGQDSHMIVRAAEADALVRVSRGAGRVEAGELVRYVPLA